MSATAGIETASSHHESTGRIAIEAKDLTKTYGNKVQALKGLSFTVEAGIVFGLLGPNGAGKSTAVKILTTLSRPTSGTAFVAGIDALKHPNRVRKAIGFVGQKSGVDREATGRENLTLQGQIFGLRGRYLKSESPRCWIDSAWPTAPTAWSRTTPAACRAASTSLLASFISRKSFSWTSLPPASTRKSASTCGPRSAGSLTKKASRFC